MNYVATYRTIRGRIDHFVQIETQSDRLLGDGERGGVSRAHPRPRNGIWFAITVMNSTLVESGRFAM
jgi:hypothetical protein